MSNLGYLYYKKAKILGSEDMFLEAAHWFRFSISKDETVKDAHYYLGCMHMNGEGIDKSYTLAFKNFKKAADYGHDSSFAKIGDLCYSGFDDNKPNKIKAYEWYVLGAERGNSQCINNLALMLEYGFDTYSPNRKEAVKLYDRAAKMGNSDAFFNLGLAYQNGVHVEVDELMAIDLMKKSANMGNYKAQNYLINIGVVKDRSEFVLPKDFNAILSDDELEEESEEDEANYPPGNEQLIFNCLEAKKFI